MPHLLFGDPLVNAVTLDAAISSIFFYGDAIDHSQVNSSRLGSRLETSHAFYWRTSSYRTCLTGIRPDKPENWLTLYESRSKSHRGVSVGPIIAYSGAALITDSGIVISDSDCRGDGRSSWLLRHFSPTKLPAGSASVASGSVSGNRCEVGVSLPSRPSPKNCHSRRTAGIV